MARTYFSGSLADLLASLAARGQIAGDLRRKTELLGLLQEVAVAANEASSLKEAVQFTLDTVCAFTGWPIGHAYMASDPDGSELRSTPLWHLDDPQRFGSFQRLTETTHFAPGMGLPGRVSSNAEPAWIVDVTLDPSFSRAAEVIGDAGMKAAFAFPVSIGEQVVAVLEFFSTEAMEPDAPLLEVMAHIGVQLGHVVRRLRGEEMLKRRESQLAEAQQVAHLGSWDWDIKTDTVTWSDELYRIYGFRPQEFSASFEAFIEYVHPDDRQFTAEAIKKTYAAYESFDVRHRIIRPDGMVRILHSLGHVVNDEAGQPEKLVGTCYDITEQAEAERSLRRSEERFRHAFEYAAFGVALLATDGRFLRVNRFLCDMLGYSPPEFLQMGFHELTHPDDLEVDVKLLQDMLGGRRDYGWLEKRYVHKEGHVIWALQSTSLVRDSRGAPLYLISQIQDISERKRAEEALRQSEKRFREIFEKGAISIYLLDLSGRVLVCNPAFREMLGYDDEEELYQLTFADYTHPADLRLNRELFEDLVAGKREVYRVEKRYLRKDGLMVWGHLTVSLVRDAEGNPQYAIGMVKDITERKEIQAELAEVQHQLMESREAERLHLAQELHDGPVQDLYALSYRLRELGEMQPDESSLGQIIATVADLERVLQTLRTITSELRPPALAPFGVEKAIRSHVKEFRRAHPNLKVQLDLMPDTRRLPEQVRLALFRIYQGALSNVMRHAEASLVSVRFSLGEKQVVLEIQDDGHGFAVPQRWISLVRQGHLGLAGMAERAEAIGGQLRIVSAPGEGTLVKVVVPCLWETETASVAGKQPDDRAEGLDKL